MIRPIESSDYSAIKGIYNHYLLNTVITFEEEAVSDDEMKSRIQKISKKYPYLIYEENEEVMGFAYASQWKWKSAYNKTVETTIYLDPNCVGKGVGFKLYSELIEQLKKENYHALIGGVSLPNDASIHLHKKLGFQKIALFKEVGWKFNKWVDVEYWELIV